TSWPARPGAPPSRTASPRVARPSRSSSSSTACRCAASWPPWCCAPRRARSSARSPTGCPAWSPAWTSRAAGTGWRRAAPGPPRTRSPATRTRASPGRAARHPPPSAGRPAPPRGCPTPPNGARPNPRAASPPPPPRRAPPPAFSGAPGPSAPLHETAERPAPEPASGFAAAYRAVSAPAAPQQPFAADQTARMELPPDLQPTEAVPRVDGVSSTSGNWPIPSPPPVGEAPPSAYDPLQDTGYNIPTYDNSPAAPYGSRDVYDTGETNGLYGTYNPDDTYNSGPATETR